MAGGDVSHGLSKEGRERASDTPHARHQLQVNVVHDAPPTRSLARWRLQPMGGEGKTVEIDETFIGGKRDVEARPGWVHHKHAVFTLVEREVRPARSMLMSQRKSTSFRSCARIWLAKRTS